MEKMEIKLKECCLTCDNFYLRTDLIGVYCSCGNDKREISCVHMPVCYKYNNMETKEKNGEPLKAKWEYFSSNGVRTPKCSNCGYVTLSGEYSYCPHCGAKMSEE